MIKFDAEGRVQDYTFILSLRNHDHLGQIRNVDPESVVSKINLNGANELSFTIYKEDNDFIEPLWDEIVDFKFVYVKELDEYYEIKVEKNDEETLYKTVTGTSACEAELSQSYVYGLEINTEADIDRTDYTSPTVFYDKLKPEASLLNRVLYKLPQYSIKYVDASLERIQRTFSFDGTDVLSMLTGEIAQEVGCLFVFDTTDRSISAYDLKTVCVDCGHRGEFSDACPECGSSDLKYFGDDTTIYVDTENLAENVVLSVDTDSVKNCFKLEAGDDDMTAAIRNLNPNGSDYIYYFSEEQKHDMPDELVTKLESYDKLCVSYEKEYEQVMADMYEAIDKVIYYTSGMMPKQEDDPTNAKLEAAKLTQAAMSPMSLTTVTSSTSTATVNSALKNYAKVFVKSGYFKIDINQGEFAYEGTDVNGNGYGYWYGNFKITNYSDEEDVATSSSIRIKVDMNFDTFLEQKIKKQLALDDEEGSIFDVLSIEDLSKFKKSLTYYGLNRLTSFYDAIQGCIDIMIEMDQGHENADLYETMYIPYYDKLVACQAEIDKRQATIDEWGDKLDAAEKRRNTIQKTLNFGSYLGEELYRVFCMYKREDKYSNANYISNGLENDEIFENARKFIEVAKEELVKSGEHQRSISSTLANLLCMPEFEPIKEKFNVGNFIRVGIDGEVYRLRLISYQISFGSIQNIDVEFSNVTKMQNGMSDLQSILSKASSMASTYGAVTNQVEKSKVQTDFVGNFVNKGFDTTAVKIVNNADNQNITMGESGLLARRKDEFYEKYDDTQLKLLSTGLYVTDNAWKSVKTAIGKYYYTDPKTGKTTESYGLLADTIVGNLILGHELGIYSSDESAEMSFDNGGLVLNTKDNGTGQYKRIFDIQKDGVSQMYVDTDGNIVFADDQFVQVVESVLQQNIHNLNVEQLYAKTGTIDKLFSEDATIDELNTELATIDTLNNKTINGEKATFSGKVTANAGFEAKNAEIETLKVTGEAEIANLKFDKATLNRLDAGKIVVNDLVVEADESGQGGTAVIDSLTADEATIDKLYLEVADMTELDVVNLNVSNKATIELAEVTEELTAKKAVIEDLSLGENGSMTIPNLTSTKIITKILDAESAEVDELTVSNSTLTDATIINLNVPESGKADIHTLDTDRATIELLDATTINVTTLNAENLKIEELESVVADIGVLEAQVANINTIMAGNIGSGLIQTVHLTADNVVIDDAVIKSAMIDNIDTNIVRIGNHNIVISGSTQQFRDDKGVVRLQIGKDAQGNFNFIVFGEDGKTRIYSHEGITDKAVPDGLIVDNMVSEDAGIQAKKIQYVDKDGNTTLQTHLEVEQGKIENLVKETTIENGDGTTTTLKDAYTQTVQTVEGHTTSIGKVNTSINTLNGQVESMSSQLTEIKATAEGISTKVSSMDFTNRNYIRNSKTMIFKTYGFVNNPQEQFVGDELDYLTDEEGNMYTC